MQNKKKKDPFRIIAFFTMLWSTFMYSVAMVVSFPLGYTQYWTTVVLGGILWMFAIIIGIILWYQEEILNYFTA